MVALAGAAAIARQSLEQQRSLFETDARIVHRLLSQQVVQHDAMLATLALLQPAPDNVGGAASPEQRLPVLYPQILSVQRRDPDERWSDALLTQAETLSRQTRRAALGGLDLTQGRYQLVLAATPTSYALTIDLRAMVPWPEWPMKADNSPVRVTLEHAGQRYVVQAGAPAADAPARGWRFNFHKLLAAESQPFDVVATRAVGWGQLPWGWMLAWTLGVAALLTALHHLQRQRSARRRTHMRVGPCDRRDESRRARFWKTQNGARRRRGIAERLQRVDHGRLNFGHAVFGTQRPDTLRPLRRPLVRCRWPRHPHGSFLRQSWRPVRL